MVFIVKVIMKVKVNSIIEGVLLSTEIRKVATTFIAVKLKYKLVKIIIKVVV